MQAGLARGVPGPEGGILPAVQLPKQCRAEKEDDDDDDDDNDD